MKKKLVASLAAAMVVGLAGTSFAAANPFSDVPAKHWAYDSVLKLEQAGLTDGYGDGTYKGDKLITRYEMAQIVAKAMARSDKADAKQQAEINKLAVEYADELNTMGVRISALESKVSNIKISADARMRYDSEKTDGGPSLFKDRYRLNMNAAVNDQTSVYARYVYTDGAFEGDKNRLSDLAFTTKKVVLGTDVTLGRYTLNLGPTTFFSGTTGNVEGIQTNTKVGKANLMLGFADDSYYEGVATSTTNGGVSTATTQIGIKNIEFGEFTYAASKKFKLNADYFANRAGVPTSGTVNTGDIYQIAGGGLVYQVTRNVALIGEYYVNNADGVKGTNNNTAPKAKIIRLAYKGATPANPGSWGAFVETTKFDPYALPYAMVGPYTKVGDYTTGGLKSNDVNVNYTLARNITLEGVYQFDMKKATTGADLTNSNFTRVQINYFF